MKMGTPENCAALDLEVTDVSGQKSIRVSDLASDATVGELIKASLEEMSLPENDVSGRPLVYHALLEREGRHLQGAEIVSEAVRTGDRVVLQPNVDAGS
jgi:hypothetical protein